MPSNPPDCDNNPTKIQKEEPQNFVREINYRLGRTSPPMFNYQDNGLVETVSLHLDYEGAEIVLWTSEDGGFSSQYVIDELRSKLFNGMDMYNEIADTKLTTTTDDT